MFFEKVSLVTGGFDPIHSGHISYFKRAKDLSNYLIAVSYTHLTLPTTPYV